MKLFHYTDKSGYEGIQHARMIRPSTNGRYGPGVYLTNLNPNEHSCVEIAEKLYKGGAQNNMQRKRLDHYVEVDVPNTWDICHERENVFRYIGGPLDLDNCCTVHSQGHVDDWSPVLEGALLVAAATAVAGTVYDMYTARRTRAAELQTELERFLTTSKNQAHFEARLTDSGDHACVYCRLCRAVASEEYDGGLFWPDSIDEAVLRSALNEHLFLHFCRKVILIAAPVVILLFYWTTTKTVQILWQ